MAAMSANNRTLLVEEAGEVEEVWLREAALDPSGTQLYDRMFMLRGDDDIMYLAQVGRLALQQGLCVMRWWGCRWCGRHLREWPNPVNGAQFQMLSFNKKEKRCASVYYPPRDDSDTGETENLDLDDFLSIVNSGGLQHAGVSSQVGPLLRPSGYAPRSLHFT
jgi:hypothetical protein